MFDGRRWSREWWPAALAVALLCAVCAACSRYGTRVEAPPAPTATPLALEPIGYGQRGTDGAGAPLPPGYLFRLAGITAEELQTAFDAHGTDTIVARPPGRATAVAPDLLVIQPALRVAAGQYPVRLSLPDGRSAAATLDIPAVSYAFPDGVTEEERAQIREGVAIAERFAARELGFRLSTPITVWAREGVTSAGYVAEGRAQQIRIRVEHTGWTARPGALRRTLVAHEYFHLIQEELSGAWHVPPGPGWLGEGSAEVFATRAGMDAGLPLSSLAVDCWTNVALSPGTPALEAIDQGRDLAALRYRYSIGALAAHRLAEIAGLGALAAFFEQTAKGGPWQAAFERAFGRDLDTFYGEFAQYRAGLPPPAINICRE